jgi:DNA-binding HxlR family transcriptional regulator
MVFFRMPKSDHRSAAAMRRSSCPVANTLDLVGDRWTLLLVRDLFAGKQRYGEFAASPEGIPTNILAERLRRLEAAGIIASAPYQQNPPRHEYKLTAKGKGLAPVLIELGKWGLRHVPGTAPGEKLAAFLR